MAGSSAPSIITPDLVLVRWLRGAATAAFCLTCLWACGGGDVRTPAQSDAVLLEDGTVDLTESSSAPPLIRVSSRLVGTSGDAKEADIVIDWTLDQAGREVLTRNSVVFVAVLGADGSRTVVSRQRIEASDDDETVEGEIDVVVPADTDVAEIQVGLDNIEAGRVTDAPTYATVNLPAVLRAEDTDLDRILNLRASLEPGSYTSAVEDGRRMHRFSVRVEAELDGITDENAESSSDSWVSVTGLDFATSQHFIAVEDGYNDPESPVRAAYVEQPITVFLVMDVSSSITLAGAADELLDAVSRTLLALAPVAAFDLRVFASDVFEIDSLRDLAFDELTDSGTALYRAVDTALDDIESTPGDVVLIGFTDGRDLASRNFYPAFLSHGQVLDYVADRLANVGTARRELLGQRFEAHFVSLGSNIDIDALNLLAAAGNGAHYPSYSTDTVKHAFEHLTSGVRGVYQLEYSSQQQAGDSSLVLQVHANGVSSQPIELPTRVGLAPSD